MRRNPRSSRIPASRLERFARAGWMAGEAALGGLWEKARQLRGGEETSSYSSLLNVAAAERLARRLSSMRGAAMKLGQILSLEGEDLLPAEVARALAMVRADADSMPETQLRRVLGHAYGRGWEKRFRSFDPTPVAAASIGQVHRVEALDGRHLALKVQFPGIAKSIDSDVDNMAAFLRLSRLLPAELDLGKILQETKRQLREETDYVREAAHLRTYGGLVRGDSDLLVPAAHDDLTTHRVLAMDFIDGERLDVAEPHLSSRQRDRIGTTLYRLFFREVFEFRTLQSDPNFANYLVTQSPAKLALLDFGATREISQELSDCYRRIFRAGVTEDRAEMAQGMRQARLVQRSESVERVERLVDLFMLGCEPFRHRGPYDFAASTISGRAREIGFDLTLRKGFRSLPPPEVLFLHRKLGGTFLLCARLGARVNMRKLLSPFLQS